MVNGKKMKVFKGICNICGLEKEVVVSEAPPKLIKVRYCDNNHQMLLRESEDV